MSNMLRRKREDARLSQTRLAILAGLSNSLVSEFELGKRRPWPRAKTALARVLGCSEQELFGSEGSNERDS